MIKIPISYVTNLIVFLLLLTPYPALADVQLPKILGDGLVLQRDKPNTVWGWAETGEKVTVKIDGQEIGSAIATDGRWAASIGSHWKKSNRGR
jgi:sialate O-acetylesterase